MKKYLFFLFAVFCAFICGCSKESINASQNAQNTIQQSELEAEFAVILSKALYQEEGLRRFVKNQALKEFDKDYDVFYPLLKDEIVENNESFHMILSRYDDKDILSDIEANCPLINILVPDWSWIDAFSIHTWDTDIQDISVILGTADSKHYVYTNGKLECILDLCQIPGFASVIVNNNDRVKMVETKGANKQYLFIDDEFNGALSSKTKAEVQPIRDHEYYDRTFETVDYSNFMSTEDLKSKSGDKPITAYYMFANNSEACHRDFLYYGMTNTIQAGKLNSRVYEYITKFRFETLDCDFLLETEDFISPGSYERYVYVQDGTLLDRMCYNGNLEIYFDIFIGNKDTSVSYVRKMKSVSFKEAFQLSKVHVDFMHKTWFSSRKWVYTVDKNCFVPKWIDVNLKLPKWDLSNQSSIMNIYVSEFDNATTETYHKTINSSISLNFTTEVETSIPSDQIGNSTETGNIKVGYGDTISNSTSIDVEVTTTNTTDDLGMAQLYYHDPIILSSATLNGENGFRVKEISTGFVRIIVLPRYE